MTQFLTLVDGLRQLTNVSAADLPDLGIGLSSQQIFYGSSTPGVTVNENIVIPPWAITYRIMLQAASAGAQGGGFQPTAGTAVNGGSSSAGGYHLDVSGKASGLRSLGGTTIGLVLGAPGQGGAPRNSTGTGNLGTNAADTTAAIGAAIFARARGGGSTLPGGTQGGPSVAGSAGAGATGASALVTQQTAAGGAGAGIAANGPALNGGQGGLGGTQRRNPTEAAALGGVGAGTNGANALEVLVAGVPVPGNGAGGGASHPTANGGNGGQGINGGGSGGGGAARVGQSGAGGNGGRAFAVIEFFGSDGNPLLPTSLISFATTRSDAPLIMPGGRLQALNFEDEINGTNPSGVVTYRQYSHAQVPVWSGTDWAYRSIEAGLISSVIPANTVADISITQTGGLVVTPWTNSTTRATVLTRRNGIRMVGDNTWLGTVFRRAAGDIVDQPFQRGIWNCYNQVTKPVQALEAALSWTYSSAAARPFNNSTLNRVELVAGLGAAYSIGMQGRLNNGALLGVGLNSMTSPVRYIYSSSTETDGTMTLSGALAPGFHYLQMLEASPLNTAVTFRGENIAGLMGTWLC